MKKLFFTLFTSLVAFTSGYAQESFATFAALMHNGTLTSFTGAKALEEAVAKAEAGDVITLSAGAFDLTQTLELKKSVTLRGAGMDIASGKNLTRVNGTLFLNPSEAGASFTFEGIDFGGGFDSDSPERDDFKVTINKCIISFAWFDFQHANDILVNSSKIYNFRHADWVNVKCQNSVIFAQHSYGATYYSCVVTGAGRGTFENCICSFMDSSLNESPAKHCIYVNNEGWNPFTPSAINVDMTVVNSWADVFSFDTFEDNADWMRSQDFAVTGSFVDHSIGIYGGSMPFSATLDLPTIKSLKVGKVSKTDGTLSIDVEFEN